MKRFLLAFGMLLMAVVMTAGPNLAPSAVITASSVTATNTDAHLAQTAGDGELTTCWATDSQAAGEWLLFTWSTAQTINKLQLTWDVETYTYARSFAVYAIDEMPEELKGKPLTAAMLPKSAKMIYSLSSRELAGINSEQFYTDDVTTKNLLILFGEPVAEGRGVGVSEVYVWNIEGINRLKTLTVSPTMIRQGQPTEMVFGTFDQDGHRMEDDITLSVNAGDGTLAGNTLTAAKSGWLTITAYDENAYSKTNALVYVVGDATAPAAPAAGDVYASLLPASAGTTVYTDMRGNKAEAADEFAAGGQTVKMVRQCGTLVINNSEVSSALDQTFIPSERLYDKLHFEIFSPTDATGKLQVEGVGEQQLTLAAGQWKAVEMTITEAAAVGNITLQMDFADGKYPDVVLANIYFTKAPIKMTWLTATPQTVYANQETAMTLEATDQFGTVIADNVVFTVADGSGATLTKDKKLTATNHGLLTITATDTISKQTVTAQIYVIGNEDAPAAPDASAVFAGLLPATKGTTVFAATGTAARPQDMVKLNGIDVKPVFSLDELTISNSEVTAAQGATFSPMERKYETLHIEIFPTANAEGTLKIGGVGEQKLTLTAGQWTKVDVSVEMSKEMGDISIAMKKQGNKYPDILLANIYFTRTPLKLSSLTVEPGVVVANAATQLQLTVRDQFDNALTDNLAFSVPDGSGATLTKEGLLTAANHGWLTITAKDTIENKTVTAQVYVLGDEDAPVAPDASAVFAGLLPATKGTTVFAATGAAARPQNMVKLNGIDVKPVFSLDELTISNSEVTAAQGGKFSPMERKYETLHFEIFSTTAAGGTLKISGVGEQKLTLTAGQWTKVDVSVEKSKEMGDITVSMEKQGDKYPDVLLSNIYFTRTPLKLSSMTAEPRMVMAKTATQMLLTVRDQFDNVLTDNLVFNVPDDSGATLTKDGLLTAANHGWLTITAKDTIENKTVTAQVYVLGDEDGPAAPAASAVYAGLLPATAGTTVYTPVSGSTSQQQAIVKLNKIDVKPVFALDTISVSNSEVTAALGGKFSPVDRKYETLHFEIFSPTDAEGTLRLDSIGDQQLTLSAGKWTKIDVNLANAKVMGNMTVAMKKKNGLFPDVVLANIYFTKTPVKLTSMTATPRFAVVNTATQLQVTVLDQFAKPVTDNLVYSVPDGATLTKDFKLTAKNHGWLTITARDTVTAMTATARIYVLGNEDAPAAPDSAAVFGGLLPVTKGTTVYTPNVGGKAQPQPIVKLKKIDVKPVYELDTLRINNNDITCALDTTFSAVAKFYDKLHFEIFSPSDATGTLMLQGVGEQSLKVTGGKWTKAEFDVSKVTKMGNITVIMKKQGEMFPDVVLSNIYFTKVKVDSTDFVLSKIEAGNRFIPKNKAVDLKLTAKNKKGVDLSLYSIYNVKVSYSSNKGTFDSKGLFTATADGPIAIVGTAGEGKWLARDTIYVETYPNADAAPTQPVDSVMAVYSETYGALSYTPSENTANGGYKLQQQLELTTTDKAIFTEDAVCFGIKLNNMDLTRCDSVHLSVYSYEDITASLSIDGTPMAKMPFSLKNHQWNHVVMPLSGTRNKATWLQLFVGTSSKKNSVVIDNVYFHRDQLFTIITSFSVGQRLIHKNDTVDLQISARNYQNADITSDITVNVSKGTLASLKKYVTKEDGPITVTATGPRSNSFSAVVHTLPSSAVNQPTEPSNMVKAVYSDTYGANSYSASGSYEKQYEVQLRSGDRAIAAIDAVSVSLSMNRTDLSDYIWMKASVFSTEDFSGYVEIEGTSMERQYMTLKKYEWTDMEILLTEPRSAATALRFVVGSGNQPNTVVIDNVYFIKMSEGSLYIAKQANAQGMHQVLGVISDKNKAVLEKTTDVGCFDMTKVNFGESKVVLTPQNKNAVICIEGTTNEDGDVESRMYSRVEGSHNVVVRNSDGTFTALTPIELVDNYYHEHFAVFNSGIIRTGDLGFTYKRSVMSGAIETLVLPVSMELPEGLNVYNMYEYNSDHGLTFGLQRGRNVQMHQPYVIRNTTKNSIAINIEGKGNLDLRRSSEGVDQIPGGAAMHANYSVRVEPQIALLNGSKYEAVNDDNPVGIFRAYFTGLMFLNTSIYLHDGTKELQIAEKADEMGAIEVLGEITGSNKKTVEAVSTTAFDFEDALIGDTVTAFNPVNKNALVIVKGTIENGQVTSSPMGERLKNTRNLVVKGTNGQLVAMNGIVLTDDEQSPVWRMGTIDTGTKGFTYTRGLPAREYTSTAVPADVAVPRGVEVYELMDYTVKSGLTINRLETQTLQKNCPYILYNTTDSVVAISAKGTGILDLRAQQEQSYSIENAGFQLTMRANYGTTYEKELYQVVSTPVGKVRGAMAKAPKYTLKLQRMQSAQPLVAFRGYISGLPSDGSLDVSVNDETKKIKFASVLDSKGFMAVKGLISDDSRQQVEQFFTSMMAGLDLRAAQFDDDLLAVTPNNPNTLLLMPGTVSDKGEIEAPEASRLTATQNMVVLGSDGKYYPVKRIVINDSEETPLWWPDFTLVTSKLGFDYNRIIRPGELATLCIPVYVALPNGLELYQFSAYSSDDNVVTFSKSPATLISQNQPCVVYNTTDKDIVVSYSDEKADLCLDHTTDRTKESGKVSFNSSFGLKSTADSDVWTIDSDKKHFRRAEGQALPSYRCYFTGVDANTVLLFTDGTLGISDISVDTIDNEHYYTTDGRRVQTPRKGGLYIKGGKKVVVRKAGL
ncbi:MAG: hypothetical protein IJP74_06580 [Prevotella sp.]|nr:hypothetical protein [Prevotella sp.]